MRVHDDPFVLVEGVAENNVGSLATDPGQIVQLLHGRWDFPIVFFGDGSHRSLNALGLVAIKTGRFDRVFELRRPRAGVVFRGPVFFEQRWRDHVHPFIGALGRQDCRHEQLQGTAKIQFAMHTGIDFRPGFKQFGHTLARGHVRIISVDVDLATD